MDPELFDDTSAARTAQSSYCRSEVCTCIFTLPWFLAGYLLTKPECPVPLSLAYFFLMIVLAAGTVIGIGLDCAGCPMMLFLFILARLFAIIGLECWLVALVTNTASNEKLCGAFPYIYGWIIVIICIIALLPVAIAIICCSICTCCAQCHELVADDEPSQCGREERWDARVKARTDYLEARLPTVGVVGAEKPTTTGTTLVNENARDNVCEVGSMALQTQWAYKDRRQVPGANPNEQVRVGDSVRAKQQSGGLDVGTVVHVMGVGAEGQRMKVKWGCTGKTSSVNAHQVRWAFKDRSARDSHRSLRKQRKVGYADEEVNLPNLLNPTKQSDTQQSKQAKPSPTGQSEAHLPNMLP